MTEPSTRTPIGGLPTPEHAGGPLGHGIPLGRWGGVAISAHWSVLFTLALFADLLATSALPAARPGQGSVAYWLAGILTAALFLATLLVHELAHAIAARHYRMRVQKITLWMLGGLTELEGEAPTPRADAVIAAAGPATSFGLGALSAGFAWWVGGEGLFGAALSWLAGISVLLGVFNLLPGAPLDGGRLLRALLWWCYHDRARGAVSAARAGRILGMFLIILGFLEVTTGSFAGLWLALIGWFIMSGAASERSAAGMERLRGLHAADVMTTSPTVVAEWWTVAQLLAQLTPEQAIQPVLAVVDFGGRANGTVTLRDLERVRTEQRADTRIRELARVRRTGPLMVQPDAALTDIAVPLRLHGGIGIVIDHDSRPIGVITANDLGRAAQLGQLGKDSTPTRPT